MLGRLGGWRGGVNELCSRGEVVECEQDVIRRVLHYCDWHADINAKQCRGESEVWGGGLEEDLGYVRGM